MRYTHKNTGTCSRSVSFDIDEQGKVHNVEFVGGCNGNLKGIAALCEGCRADELADRLCGITCGFKSTSCPDQLSHALKEALAEGKGDEE